VRHDTQASTPREQVRRGWALDHFFDWLDGKNVDPIKCFIEHGVADHDHRDEERSRASRTVR
jgi:hypothetical protein